MRQRVARTIGLLAVGALAMGCGSGGYGSLDEAIAEEGCEVSHHADEKMFATDEVHCEDGTIISWHANEIDRNAYAEFLKGFLDATPDEQGEWYNIYRG